MTKKDKQARIITWKNNTRFIEVAYVQRDGQEIIGMYERFGWTQPLSGDLQDLQDVHKDKPSSVLSWKNNSKFIEVAYIQKDGQEVIGKYERWGWIRPPYKVVRSVLKSLSNGPRRVVGRQK